MEVPKFLKKTEKSLLFNLPDSTFVFYVPYDYFSDSKVPIAQIVGQYVSTIGLFNWAIIDKNGKQGPLHTFYFPTMFMCKPAEMEKVRNLSLNGTDPADYMLLKFYLGDEVVSETRVPQMIDNVEITFKMSILTAKIPNTIPYDKLWEIFMESAALNGFSYNLNIQLFGVLISRLCRDANNIEKMFCETDMKDMTKYKMIDIRMVPKFISPYTAITSENWDEAVRAAILMKDNENTPVSPLEKVMTM
jgi:hypothetical protein